MVLYTDGITESRNRHGHNLEEWGLMDIINQVVYFNQGKNLTAFEIVNEIKQYLQIFFGDTKIDDDCSLMVILNNRKYDIIQ